MKITFRGKSVESGSDLFEMIIADHYSTELKTKRYDLSEIPQNEKKIGTVNATSCLGVVYRTADMTYVQHHDGRSQDDLYKIIDKRLTWQVTLVGGCKIDQKMEIHTKENIEKMFSFWKKGDYQIDIQGWLIGEGNSYETLCSDFIVTKDELYLLKQGVMDGEVQHNARRLATVLINGSSYFFVYNDVSKMLELAEIKNVNSMKEFAKYILQLDDAKILEKFSTTPKLEPSYFAKLMRDMATYLLEQTNFVKAVKFKVNSEFPVLAIQGEILKMRH